MSNRIFKQDFASGFKGIDGVTSALEEPEGEYNRAQNIEFSVSNSLRGRVGCQTIAMIGAGSSSVFAASNVFQGKPFALFSYNYTRTKDEYKLKYQAVAGAFPTQTASLSTTKTSADGASIQKVIALNQQAWVQDTMDIVVTRASGTYPFTWYTYVDLSGDWTRVAIAGAVPGIGSLGEVCCCATGSPILACDVGTNGFLYYSFDNGATWTASNLAHLNGVLRCANSSTGVKAIACLNTTDFLYTSTDLGVTWTARAGSGSRLWTGVASDSTGAIVLGITATSLYRSTDSGITWTLMFSGGTSMVGVRCSSDGTKIYIIDQNNSVRYSTNSGATFSTFTDSILGTRTWVALTCSPDGTKIAVCDQGGYIYTSANSGNSWTQQTGSGARTWTAICISSSGVKIAATSTSSGAVYISNDSGVTWLAQSITTSTSGNYRGVAMRSDGRAVYVSEAGSNEMHTFSDSLSAVNTIRFAIKANGVAILDKTLGDGISTTTSIYALLGAIDATTELTISRTTRGTCPPYGIASGGAVVAETANTYGARTRVPMTSHNFMVGDIVCLPTTPMSAGFVTDINVAAGTNIVYAGTAISTPSSGTVFGYMNQAATSFPIAQAVSAASGNLTISFPYWRYISEGDSAQSATNYGKFFQSAYSYTTTPANKTASSFFAPPTSVNASGNLYIAASGTVADVTANSVGNALTKIDGQQVMRAGLPAPTIAASRTGAGNVLSPVKYKCFFRRYDAQGNIIDGPLSNIINTGSVAAGVFDLTVSGYLYSAFSGYQTRSCYKNTAAATAANQFMLVDDNTAAPGQAAFIQPGDPIYYVETNTAQTTGVTAFGATLGLLHKTVCTDYDGQFYVAGATPASIRVADSDGVVNIANNSPMSTGLTVVFLRTALNGNQYYVLAEVPYTGYATLTITDDALDADLITKEQFLEPVLGKEHDPPGQCSLVTQHQGGLVIARGIGAPNTVSFSTVEGIEYFPLASNSFDVPSIRGGAITAIASDTNDRLAVCKEKSYFDIAGDLDGGAFSVNVISDGDLGVTSQASLQRVKDTLIGLSKNGFVGIQDGNISSIFIGLNTRLINQAYNFGWAVAANDSFNRSYVCSVPTSSEPVTYVIDYSRIDPQTLKTVYHTFERTTVTQIDPGLGIALSGDTLYHMSTTSPYAIFRRLVRFNGDSPSGYGNGDSFIDNTNAITYVLESNPISDGDPAKLKTPIRIRLWSIPNDYIIDGWVAFSTLIETGASALATYIAGNGGTSTTVSFTTANDAFKDRKLVNTKTHFYMVRFTTNSIRTAPFWTGYEIMFADNYPKEDLIK